MSNWHVTEEIIARYVDDEVNLDHVTVASIEEHVERCPSCQRGVRERTRPELLDQVWSGVADRVDRTESGVVERWIVRLGVEPAPARLLGATAGLRVATVAAVVLVVAAMVWASRAADAAGVYLALAPVVPTALVAISFATDAEPGGESGLATPVFGFPLLLRRALAVEVLALLVLAAGSLFISLDGPRAVAWLLPATALSVGTVAVGTRWPAPHAATALLGGWFGVLAAGELIGRREGVPPLVDTPVFGTIGQLVAGGLLVVSMGVVYLERHHVFQEVAR